MRRPLIDPLLDRDDPRADSGYEWIAVAAQVERLAPDGVSVDDLARVEDAAAEWVFQRSLLRSLEQPAPGPDRR
jgi:hypothetical protein